MTKETKFCGESDTLQNAHFNFDWYLTFLIYI